MTDRDVSFDPVIDDEVVETVKTAADGPVFVVVEFTPEEFEVVYASRGTRDMYEDEDAMYDYFEMVHDYVNLDLAEIDLFTENLFPVADDVRYITTALDIGKMIRVYVNDRRGVFVGLPTEAEVEPVVEALFEETDR
jgi:hypothetical protein